MGQSENHDGSAHSCAFEVPGEEDVVRVRDADWYEGSPPTVPAVELNGVRLVACPFCDGTHSHDADGLHVAPCNWPQARYLVRGLKPLAFVRLMLRRLGFDRDEVQQIIAEAVRVYALDWSAALARRMAARSTPPVEVLRD